MAKHVREYHTCDICGAEMDKPYHGGQQGTHSLVANSDYAVAGDSISWKDLCQPCNSWLGRHIDDLKEMRKDIAASAKREAIP